MLPASVSELRADVLATLDSRVELGVSETVRSMPYGLRAWTKGVAPGIRTAQSEFE